LVAAVGFVTGDLDLARDAVDEACARAWERLRRGADIDVLAAWVRTVAMNYARGRFRRAAVDRRARQRLVSTDDPGDGAIDARLDVHRALATLPRRQREACVCFYFLDCSVAETATTLGMTETNVKSSLHRARQALAQLVGTPAEVVNR
jgi:RNA polymerase sigma-70 factor (ECF subfamily)